MALRWGGERRVLGADPYAAGNATATGASSTTATGSVSGAGSASSQQGSSRPAPAQGNAVLSAPPTDPSLLLTVSGYIINRERIEISPRFQGVVEWIGVRKGDLVKKGQVLVRLENAEQRARVQEAEGRLATAKIALARAELALGRVKALRDLDAISEESHDEARLNVEAARSAIREIEGQLALVRTYLDWTVIQCPIDGVVLEKLVEPGELVAPMSFGGPRGPSTALVAVADLNDLQVEVDISEADLGKVAQGARCRVTPEAYPEKHYEGVVAEIAPEANRQKGTLQVKVQIRQPDRFLTPELTAKVDFLR
jgi:HlyD family secretion protein